MTKVEELEKALDSNENIFLTGSGGVGKSWCVENVIIPRYSNPLILGSTGISALNVGGITIHKALGLGINFNNWKTQIYKNRYIIEKYMKGIDAVIIDEVSMLKAEIIDILDAELKMVYENDKPFGGIQVIAVGDFLQLPPVSQNNEPFEFAFESKAWNFKKIELTDVKRQKDIEFINALGKMRKGTFDADVFKLAKMARDNFVNNPQKADEFTHLVPTNAEADKINAQKIAEIKSPSRNYFAAFISNDIKDEEDLKKNCPALQLLTLKVGMLVMLVANDKSGRYVNGSQGKVVDIFSDGAEILLKNGNKVRIDAKSWEKRDKNGRFLASMTQLPIIPAYAISFHKSQGQTLDGAVIHPNRIFQEHMAYVAFSRVANIENLFCTTILDSFKVKINKKVKEFYEYN